MHPHQELNHPTIRAQFPILSKQIHGQALVYLDSAASAQLPRAVIDAINAYHSQHHANIHRGVYLLSQTATFLYENARATVARFINAAEPAECIFTRGATESINLVAATWGRAMLQPGDEILLSTLEHHSNIVPWQMVAQATGARIKIIPINDAGELILDEYQKLLSTRTRLVAITHVSNALGTINPVATMIAAAHEVGAVVLVDGAQWVAHGSTDVQALDVDFYVFSGHKIYGPTGIGVLYGKRKLLDAMPPYQGGGDMIEHVTFDETRYAQLPNKFEAGTPAIASAVGLTAALDWLGAFGFSGIRAHEQALLHEATQRLAEIPGVQIKGTAREKSGVISWVMVDPPIATLDLGTQLDLRGVCIRTGHHCCQPLMDRLGISSTARVSLGIYNNQDDIDQLIRVVTAIAQQARAAHPNKFIKNQAILINYPSATAASPELAAAEIAEIFAFLPDWPMRHQHLIELGEHLPTLPQHLKTPENLVIGCQSLVYLAARRNPDAPEILEFLADSDANIVRGLIALLQKIYSGQTVTAILNFKIKEFLAKIGLEQNLSLTRRNGLAAMVQRLHQLASH